MGSNMKKLVPYNIFEQDFGIPGQGNYTLSLLFEHSDAYPEVDFIKVSCIGPLDKECQNFPTTSGKVSRGEDIRTWIWWRYPRKHVSKPTCVSQYTYEKKGLTLWTSTSDKQTLICVNPLESIHFKLWLQSLLFQKTGSLYQKKFQSSTATQKVINRLINLEPLMTPIMTQHWKESIKKDEAGTVLELMSVPKPLRDKALQGLTKKELQYLEPYLSAQEFNLF